MNLISIKRTSAISFSICVLALGLSGCFAGYTCEDLSASFAAECNNSATGVVIDGDSVESINGVVIDGSPIDGD